MAAGTPTSVGAVLSSTVIICSAVVVLPHASVAVQVLVIVPQPSATVDTSLNVTGTSKSQLSVAVTVAGAGTAPHWAVIAAGTLFNTGAIISSTVMTCVAVVVLPHASVAVHVLVMVPQPSTTVDTSLKVTGTLRSQLSVAVTVAAPGIAPHCAVTFAGTPTSTGAMISSTV